MKYIKELNKKNQKLEKKEIIKYFIIIFALGSLIGWIYEEFFYYFTENTLENRGFLYGPYLPVYGWGSLLLTTMLIKQKEHPILVFLLSMLITGILEYFTGYFMNLIWHKSWWTYDGLFMNISGYVCLRSVLTFAIGTIFLIYIIRPIIINFIKKKQIFSTIISLSFLIVYIIDNIITFSIRY